MNKRIIFCLIMLALCVTFVWMGETWLISPFRLGHMGGLGIDDKSTSDTIVRLYPHALVNPFELEEQDDPAFFWRWSVFEMRARSWVLLVAPCIVIMILSVVATRKKKDNKILEDTAANRA